MLTPSRLLAFLAALVLTIASGSAHARLLDGTASAKNARREIFANLGVASGEFARATLDRIWEKSPFAATTVSGPRIYAYSQVIEEYVSENGGAKRLAATFTFADDLVAQTRYTSTPTGSLTPTTRFVHADGFGSTRWLTDASGAVTDNVEYDAFGETIARTGTTDIEHLYRSEQFDPNLGFYYLRARYYDPSNARFLTLDSFAGFGMDPSSLHKYTYAHNDPVANRDPSGNSIFLDLQVKAINLLANTLKVAAPLLYIAHHTVNRIGASTVATFLRQGVMAANSGLYRIAGLHQNLLRLNAGQMYERVVDPAMRMLGASAQVPIRFGGQIVARADWIMNRWQIFDTKLGQHVDMGQLAHYVRYLSTGPVGERCVTYLTLTQTPAALADKAIKLGAASGVPVRFVSILPY